MWNCRHERIKPNFDFFMRFIYSFFLLYYWTKKNQPHTPYDCIPQKKNIPMNMIATLPGLFGWKLQYELWNTLKYIYILKVVLWDYYPKKKLSNRKQKFNWSLNSFKSRLFLKLRPTYLKSLSPGVECWFAESGWRY